MYILSKSLKARYALAHSAFPGRPILWGFDRLVAAEMLADAYTVTDREFVGMIGFSNKSTGGSKE